LAYDALYDQFVAAGRQSDLTLIENAGQTWVTTYENNNAAGGGYAKARFTNNMGVHYVAGMAMAAVAFAGETNSQSAANFTELRRKLAQELSLLNQAECGGDWLEGGNYGPESMQALLQLR